MKKLPSLLLALCLVLIPGLSAFAEDDPGFAPAVEAQAFAVSMAYHEGGFLGSVTPLDPAFLWEASGWYAAWLYRTEGTDLLTEDLLRDFQRSLGVQNPPDAPDTPDIRILQSSDGARLYDFQGYKLRLDAKLGQTLSFSLDAPAPFEAAVSIREYFSAGASGLSGPGPCPFPFPEPPRLRFPLRDLRGACSVPEVVSSSSGAGSSFSSVPVFSFGLSGAFSRSASLSLPAASSRESSLRAVGTCALRSVRRQTSAGYSRIS